MAQVFIQTAPMDIADLRSSLARMDFPAAASSAHRLRGSCAAVGATWLGSLAEQFESAATAEQPGRPAVPVEEIERSSDEVRAALGGAVGSGAELRHTA